MNFPIPTKTLKMLHDYYGDKCDWPVELCQHLDDTDSLGLTPLRDSELALVISTLLQNCVDLRFTLGAKNDFLTRNYQEFDVWKI